MKRLLFHYPVLNLGGAEMSSMRLMSALADRGWDITLVVTTGRGSLEASLDRRIHLIPLRNSSFGDAFLSARSATERLRALPDLARYTSSAVGGELRMVGLMRDKYIAAATLLQGTSTRLICHRVRSGRRLHFIRNDLRHLDSTVAQAIRRAVDKIDAYVCVSEVARSSLIEAVPEAAAKAHVIYNILDPTAMRKRIAEKEPPFPITTGGPITLLTVCRLSDRSKGLVRLTRVAARLVQAGHDFRWYVAGEGADRALFELAIAERGLCDRVVLLGQLTNPFPAYAAADVVVMPSYYEGLNGAVNEAKVAGRAVVATRVSGIDEQIINGETGLIVDNDEDDLVRGIGAVISDAVLRARLTNDRMPAALLDDSVKLQRLEALFVGSAP